MYLLHIVLLLKGIVLLLDIFIVTVEVYQEENMKKSK